jgi:saposin
MLVMENLQKILGSKTTEDDVKKALDKVCAVLPSSVATECESLVNQYADEIVEIIAQELDPKGVCVLIKLCDASKYFEALKKKVHTPVPVKKVGDSIECTICTTAISYLASTLKENETRQELKDELKQICEYLPAGYQAQCDTMIDTYTDQIIDLLIDQFQPHEVCTEIGLCEAKFVTKTIHNPNPFASSVSCKSSEFMMGYLAQRLHGVKLGETMPAKDHLNWIMTAMCVQLPKGKEECNTLVKKYGSKIQALIVDHNLKPNDISKHLGLCTLGDTQKMKYISYSNYKLGMMRPKSISCTVCQYAMGYVVSALKTEKTEQVIANKFKTLVCEKLPEKALVNECGALIDNYGSELVDLLIKKLDGLTLCEALDICT